MIYISNTTEFQIQRPTAITLGKFDGLHRGHELLMKNLMLKCQNMGYASVAFTFDIPPIFKVEEIRYKQLLTRREKTEVFEQTGLDYLIECPFREQVRNMLPEEFIRWMTESLQVKCFVVGEDFHFGYQRAGDHVLLKACEERYGYETIVLPKIQENGRDISSTYVREEIAKGNMEKANRLLGYNYFMENQVVHGRKLGRKIGIPTINMIPPEDKLLPPFGVYVTRIKIGVDNFMGVTNVGRKPTVAGVNPVGAETHILDFSGNLYEEVVKIEFLTRLREERKFADVKQLQEQMQRDIAHARAFFRGL